MSTGEVESLKAKLPEVKAIKANIFSKEAMIAIIQQKIAGMESNSWGVLQCKGPVET